MDKRLEMLRKRDALLEEARGILDGATEEQRGLTEDEQARYDELESQIRELNDVLERSLKLAFLEENRRLHEAGGVKPASLIGMSQREVREYRLVRAIRAAADAARGVRDAWKGAELELEASRAVAERLGREPQGFFVPFEVQTRDLVVGTDSAGGYTVATELLGLIEMLRNKMVVRAAGATVLAGLRGDIAIPRQSGGATAYWVAESGSPTESQQTFEQIGMQPKTVGAFTDISRKLLKQSSIDVEAFVRNDLATVLALEIDRVALHGSGTAPEPTGIENTTGINTVTFTTANQPTWAEVVQMETEVAADNADLGRLAYLVNATLRGWLKTSPKVSGTAVFMWESGNTVNGYRAMASNQAQKMFFGNWADLIIGMWGGLDILVDPYTGSTSGTVRVVALQDVDIAVRHPESFCVGA